MAHATTPHTQTQQNVDPAQADLEPNQMAQDSGQGEDASIYANADGAQTGGTRAFNANAPEMSKHKIEGETGATEGKLTTRTPRSDNQGITNHSATEESERQEKVVSERPDSLAGINRFAK